MKKVILVEDEVVMQTIVEAAIHDICQLKIVSTLKDCEIELSKDAYSLLLLDVNLPDGNGFEFCKRIKTENKLSDLQVVFLTGEADIDSRVQGFELGAEDYVIKPIEPVEFKARVKAKLKRDLSDKKTFKFGDLTVDLGS